MKRKLLIRTITSCCLVAGATLSAHAALDLTGIDSFIGKGTALEIRHADLNKQAGANGSCAVSLAKADASHLSIQGFYNGNFDITASYLYGKGTLGNGPFPARDLKPDGTPGDYVGRYLNIERVLGISTSLGAYYFHIPDTLGLKTALGLLMDATTSQTDNAWGGKDLTYKSMKVEGETASKIFSIIRSLVPSDTTKLTDRIVNALAEAALKDAAISVGAVQLVLTDEDGHSNKSTLATMESYTLSSYTANAQATDVYDAAHADRAVTRSYPMVWNIDKDGSFSLLNLGNRGYAIHSGFTNISVSENGDTTALLETTANAITGTIDFKNGTFTIPEQQTHVDLTALNSFLGVVWGQHLIGKGYACNALKIGESYGLNLVHKDITGTVKLGTGEARHEGSNRWHYQVSGGKNHTWARNSAELTFSHPYATRWNLTGLLNIFGETYLDETKVVIERPDSDLTHNVHFVGTYYGNDANGTPHDGIWGVNAVSTENALDVFGALVPDRDASLVDHYEVYLHHLRVDKIGSINDMMATHTAKYDAVHGIENADKVCDVEVPVARDADGSTRFFRRIKVADITNNNTKFFGKQAAIKPASDEFSLYIKTVYKNGLEPTFHTLSTVKSQKITTSVAGVATDTDFAATALAGAIQVTSTQPVTIHDASGRLCYSGPATTVPLPAGLYIVSSGDHTAKLLVR